MTKREVGTKGLEVVRSRGVVSLRTTISSGRYGFLPPGMGSDDGFGQEVIAAIRRLLDKYGESGTEWGAHLNLTKTKNATGE